MPTIPINNGFITLSNTDFNCPFCNKEYSDTKHKYTNAINKNKSWTTTIKCSCGEKFGVANNYDGLVSFKLKNE